MRNGLRASACALRCLLFILAGCATDAEPDPAPGNTPEGALIRTSLEGTVGVLLDELPEAVRDRAAEELSAEGDDFWQARARAQVSLGLYRLVFRNFFYDEEENKGQLPLPPAELWKFEISNEAEAGRARRPRSGRGRFRDVEHLAHERGLGRGSRASARADRTARGTSPSCSRSIPSSCCSEPATPAWMSPSSRRTASTARMSRPFTIKSARPARTTAT